MKKCLIFLVSLSPISILAATNTAILDKNDIGLALFGIVFVFLMRTKGKK